MFGRFKKNNQEKKEEEKNMTTLEEIKAAFKNLSDEEKADFKQSIKDRIDESAGEQEKIEGNEDSQDAKDRVDESMGEEKAIKKEETNSTDSTLHSDAKEDRTQFEELIAPLRKEIADIRASIDNSKRESKPADDMTASKLEKLKNLYEN